MRSRRMSTQFLASPGDIVMVLSYIHSDDGACLLREELTIRTPTSVSPVMVDSNLSHSGYSSTDPSTGTCLLLEGLAIRNPTSVSSYGGHSLTHPPTGTCPLLEGLAIRTPTAVSS
ncbi:hypothetical protein AVEN_61087-1 [Araneus ventricosus]|uniref:Uncharacterized protein n=1 Tax=Araneus ventricosus TaxID=182803 RepID=A0A4Y2M4Y9_ARAVE|nr:hypothetical protein AVEN_61087-1 [Araneus ventricosus]